MESEFRQMLVLDFDGVIHSYTSGWHGADVIPDEPVPGSIVWIANMIHYSHFSVGILSARNSQPGGSEAILAWLENEFDMMYGIEEAESMIKEVEILHHKPPQMHMMIDDRGFCFRGTFPSITELESFKPWNK